MLKEDNIEVNDDDFIEPGYYLRFKERWERACGILKNQIKREKKQLSEIVKNRPNSHSINYFRRIKDAE